MSLSACSFGSDAVEEKRRSLLEKEGEMEMSNKRNNIEEDRDILRNLDDDDAILFCLNFIGKVVANGCEFIVLFICLCKQNCQV